MKIPLFVIKEIKEKMGVDIAELAISPNTIGTLLTNMYIEDYSSNKLDAWVEVNFMELLLDLNRRDYSFEKEGLYYVKSRGCYFDNSDRVWNGDVNYAVKMTLDEAVETLKQYGGDAITKV